MKDVKEFIKLFKVNIPYQPEWKYYTDTLQLSKEYKDLGDLVQAFERFEEWIEANGYSSIRQYKMECLDKLVTYIKESLTYIEYENFDYSKFKFRTLDNIKGWSFEQSKSENPDYLLSFDLSSANFNTMKSFDENNELSKDWKELCGKFFIHSVLVSSKSFRQVVFGNLNPKRNGKLQLMKMLSVVEHIEDRGNADRIVAINNDEICLSLPSDLCDEHGFSGAIEAMFDISAVLSVPTKRTVYAMKWLASGMFKKVVLFQDELDREDRYATLSGVPGNKFYRYFKTEILHKDIEERDLLFVNDGDLAKWVI